ncbi:MAG: GNAT family N-acetyltransferase [Sediminibacterium sp.]
MHSGETFTIERLDQHNVKDIPVLYYAVYGRRVSRDSFVKKYDTLYSGISYAGYIAYGKGHTPVAFLGAIPCGLRYRNKIVSAAQLTDGMTDPEHQNKGLFVQLVEKITALCRHNHIHFLFGFPNQNSLPVFTDKLGWKIYGKMDHFSMPVQAVPLEKIVRKFSWVKKIYSSYQYWVLKKYMARSEDKTSSLDPGVYKSEAYNQYRYPDSFLIVVESAVVRIRINSGLAIGEMVVAETEFDAVINVLMKISRKLGVDKIVFHCSTGSELHKMFAKRYPSDPSFTIVCNDLDSGIPLNTLKFTYADIDIY